ncbi:hypothetical protein LTR09_003305 [Extremus antarcticus]|uniref:Uncharacterized protein n=1 Tax=Extremus antarcticus TaxID=702011 RepID=A0AAJ0LUW6_9PEZI|nr:hypothetical protein LTR09_003305 [Extremus antarcticus]
MSYYPRSWDRGRRPWGRYSNPYRPRYYYDDDDDDDYYPRRRYDYDPWAPNYRHYRPRNYNSYPNPLELNININNIPWNQNGYPQPYYSPAEYHQPEYYYSLLDIMTAVQSGFVTVPNAWNIMQMMQMGDPMSMMQYRPVMQHMPAVAHYWGSNRGHRPWSIGAGMGGHIGGLGGGLGMQLYRR